MAGPSRTYVAPISFGLGDLVVSLPAIQALIATGRGGGDETWLVARSASQAALAERIQGVAGSVPEDVFDVARCRGRFVDLRDHPLQRDLWWGSPEFDRAFGPLSINEILDRICTDLGIPADFTRPVPLAANPRPDVGDAVLLVTETDGSGKRWPADRWAALAGRITAAGGDVRVVTRTEASAEMQATGIAAMPAPTPGDAVDALGACRAVVGVDTGLTHLAVQQGTPTVTICRARPVYFRPWPHCRAVVGDPCDPVCEALEREHAYNARVSLRGFEWQPWTCPVDGRCLDPIRPEHVMGALRELEW
ncbi:MAG TPA: glycosyltransferase family 9 protein [Acidimicrobiia bacterium]|jgi:ADP-heptose:LPS heptosyltransferase